MTFRARPLVPRPFNPEMADWFRRKQKMVGTGVVTTGEEANKISPAQRFLDRFQEIADPYNDPMRRGPQVNITGGLAPSRTIIGTPTPMQPQITPQAATPGIIAGLTNTPLPEQSPVQQPIMQPISGEIPTGPSNSGTIPPPVGIRQNLPGPSTINPQARPKRKKPPVGPRAPGPLARQTIMPANSPLSRTPWMAKGGKIKKGDRAFVGEEGVEEVSVSPEGEATVKPMNYEDILAQIIAGTYTKEKTKKPALTRINPMTNRPEPVPGAGEVAQTRTKIRRPSYESYPNAVQYDLQQAMKELEEKKAREEEALSTLQGGVGEVQEGKAQAQGTFDTRKAQIEQGNLVGAAALGQAKGVVSGMPGEVKATVSDLQKGAKGRTEGIVAAGNALVGRTEAGAGQAVQGAKDTRVEAISAADTLYDQGLERAENLRTEDLDAYRDMTAKAISTQRAGLDARYADMERQINAQYADNPQAKQAAMAQLNSAKSSEMGMLSNQISTHYNDTAADLRSRYAGFVSDTQTKMASLSTQARTAADNMVAAVETAMGQLKLGAGVKSLQARIDAAQMEGGLDTAGLQAISWAEQNAAKMHTELAGAITNLWNTSTQFSLMNDEARESNRISYDNLEMRGQETIANFMRNMDNTFVPLSPSMSKIMDYWSNVIEEQIGLGRLGGTGMRMNVKYANEEAANEEAAKT